MARRRKAANVFGSKKSAAKQGNPATIVFMILAGLIFAAVSAIPTWVWQGLGALLVLGFIGYIYKLVAKPPSDSGSSAEAPAQGMAPSTGNHSPVSRPSSNAISVPDTRSSDDQPVPVIRQERDGSSEHRLPPAPRELAGTRWIPMGETIEVAGISIPGGLFYFGVPGRNVSNPAAINPTKQVAATGDFRERLLNYWPDYSEISPVARRAYLNWLLLGRSDPEADIGFVFLYFYGLEYRVLVDAQKDESAKADTPQIVRELKRLLDIYGDRSGSIRSYIGGLCELLSLSELPAKLYREPIPEFPRAYEVPVYIRMALGAAAVDRAPVPASLARAWVRSSPNVRLRTPALRCSSKFDQLFELRYAEMFGDGLVLPHNKTKLKFIYRPASMALLGNGNVTLDFGDIPDVTVVSKPIQRLAELAEAVTQELEAYSRYVGKNPDAENALEGVLLLPPSLWPEAARQALNELKTKIGDGMLVLTFQELLTILGARTTLTKDKAISFAGALESFAIGVEPDILGGVRLPKPEDNLALFAIPPGEVASRATAAYQAAVLTLQVASTLAAADGNFSASEMTHLRQQIDSWTHLTPSHVRRLKAHLRLLVVAPASLPALKKKLEPLDPTTKETLGAFMATVAQADGKVTPDEVKTLEKIYKALGIDPKKVFSDVHAVAAGSVPSSTTVAAIEETGFKLDPARIAALQSDTAKVSALLANIFNEDTETEDAHADTKEVLDPEVAPAPGMMGLDEAHTAFARVLVSRPQWTREELQDVAADMDLMLDGALERVNEAAYDTHDIPFTEGEDPVEVNAEVLEKIEA
jgi:uncharacterized tellurite resistance protein B-like protein